MPLLNPTTGEAAAIPWAARSLTAVVGARQRFSDLRYADFFWNGSRWMPVGGAPILISELAMDVQITGLTEVIALQASFPPGLLSDGAIIRYTAEGTKTGSVDNLQHRYRMGTLGTLVDTLLKTMGPWGTTTYSGGVTTEIMKLPAGVAWRGAGNSQQSFPMGVASGTSYFTPVPVGNFDTERIVASMSFLPSGATDTFTIKRGARIELISVGG